MPVLSVFAGHPYVLRLVHVHVADACGIAVATRLAVLSAELFNHRRLVMLYAHEVEAMGMGWDDMSDYMCDHSPECGECDEVVEIIIDYGSSDDSDIPF
jgi:hypothetical protein